MREWVELFDEPRPFTLRVIYTICPYVELLTSFQRVQVFVHLELEVHTVYQRFLTNWQRPTPQDISGYFACLYQVCS